MEIRPASASATAAQRGVGASPKSGDLSPAQAAKLKKAAQDFESLLLRDVIKTMRQATPAGKGKGLLTGTGQNLYQDLMDDELAKALARQGGLGLATVLEKGLNRGAVAPKKPSSLPVSEPIPSPTTIPAGEESPR